MCRQGPGRCSNVLAGMDAGVGDNVSSIAIHNRHSLNMAACLQCPSDMDLRRPTSSEHSGQDVCFLGECVTVCLLGRGGAIFWQNRSLLIQLFFLEAVSS